MVRQPPFSDIDSDLLQWIVYGLSLFFFLVAIVGALGAWLGWWGLVGEILMTGGTLAGLVVATLALLEGAMRDQVGKVHEAVRQNGGKLDTLDEIQWELDRQTGVLTQIRDRL